MTPPLSLFLSLFLIPLSMIAQTGSVSPIAPMMEYREAHVMAEVDNGILAIGGFDGGMTTASCEWYDPQLDVWMPVASLPGPRQNATAHTINGDVFVIGGWDGDVTNHDDILHYSASTAGWTAVATMSSGRSGHSSVVTGWLDPKILICGGYDGSLDLATCDIFDPETFEVTPAAPMSTARSSFAMMCRPGEEEVVVAGGFNPNAGFQLASTEMYTEGSWTDLPDLPFAVDNLAGTVLETGDGPFGVTGGRVFNAAENQFQGVASGAALLGDNWVPFDLLHPHSYHAMASAGASWDASVFICGGADVTGTGVTTTYSPSEWGLYNVGLGDEGFWSETLAPEIPETNGRFRPAFARVGNLGYFTGGDAEMVGTGWSVDLTGFGSAPEADPLRRLKVFPNPAYGRVAALGIEAQESWILCDLSGAEILTGHGPGIDLRGLAPGNYVLRSETGVSENVVVVAR